MMRVERFPRFGDKLEIREPIYPLPSAPQPRVVAAGISIFGRAAVDAARQAALDGAPLALVMAAAQRAASGLPAQRTGLLPDGRWVVEGDDGLLRPVKTEDDVDVMWELPGGGHARLTDSKVVIAGGDGFVGGLDDWVSHGPAPAGVAKRLVAQQTMEDRPTRNQLQNALRLVPPDVDPWVGSVSRKGALMVLGVTGPRGVDGSLEQWVVAVQGQGWRTNAATAHEVEAMGRRGESVVEIRRFMEAGGVQDAEPPLAVALRERDAAERRARQADEGAAQVARRSRALEAERDELRQKLRDRDADVKRVAVDSYQRGADAGGAVARAAMLEMRAQVDKLGVALAKAKQEALRVNAEQAKKLSEANEHIDTLMASERRLLDEITTLEQRPLFRTVTTVVRCKGGKVLERTVETQIVTGDEAARIARADTERATKEAADLLRGEAFRVRPIPQLEWKDIEDGGQVLTVSGPAARPDAQVGTPTVDMARVEAVVRDDLAGMRTLRDRSIAAVILALCVAGSVAFGVFVGGPMVARAAQAMGLTR